MIFRCLFILFISVNEMCLAQVFMDDSNREDIEENNTLEEHFYSSYKTPICEQCICGISNMNKSNQSGRIVGGEVTSPNAYPWMVLITGNNTPACGGTLISDQYVVTAAHCTLLGYRQEELKAVVGEHDFCISDRRTATFSIEKMIPHPEFNATIYAYDIMLLKLSMRLVFNDVVRPICLPQWVLSNPARAQFPGQEGIVLGWGVKAFHSPLRSCELQEVKLPIIPRSECLMKSKYTSDILPSTLFCAGVPEGGRDSCQGDSGGPLQTSKRDGRYELIGIISNGISCGHPDFPGIYTNVPMLTAWIIVNTLDSVYCAN